MISHETDVKPLKQFRPWKGRIGILFLLLVLALVEIAPAQDTNSANYRPALLQATDGVVAAPVRSQMLASNSPAQPFPPMVEEGQDAAENFKQRILLVSLMAILVGTAIWYFFRRGNKKLPEK
jgi:hypothetical protein